MRKLLFLSMFLIMFTFICSAQTETAYDPAQALIKYEEALKLAPTDKSIMYKSGLCRQVLKDYNGSVNDFKGSLGGDVKDTVIYCDMAFSYIMLQQLPNALDNYNKAIKLDPKCAKAYLGRAMVNKVFSAKKNGNKVVEKFFDNISIGSDIDMAIKCDHKYAEAYYQRGLLKAEMNMANTALVDIKKANNLGISYEDQKFEDAISISLANYGDRIGFNPEKFVFIGDSVKDEDYLARSKKYLEGLDISVLTDSADGKLKTKWYGDILDGKSSIASRKEVVKELLKNWGTSDDIVVTYAHEYRNIEEESKICCCKDVFRMRIAGYSPRTRNEMHYYDENSLSCFAKWEYLHAKSSKTSFVSDIIFDLEFSKKLPAAVSFVISPSEEERLENSKGKSLYEFHEIEKAGENKYGVKWVEGHGTRYNFKKIASGDFNNDSIEDIMIYVFKYCIEGRCMYSSLYIFTRYSDKEMMSIIKEY